MEVDNDVDSSGRCPATRTLEVRKTARGEVLRRFVDGRLDDPVADGDPDCAVAMISSKCTSQFLSGLLQTPAFDPVDVGLGDPVAVVRGEAGLGRRDVAHAVELTDGELSDTLQNSDGLR